VTENKAKSYISRGQNFFLSIDVSFGFVKKYFFLLFFNPFIHEIECHTKTKEREKHNSRIQAKKILRVYSLVLVEKVEDEKVTLNQSLF